MNVIDSNKLESGTQISLRNLRKLDCFAAEFIIGPDEVRTRWLFAMTPFDITGDLRDLISDSEKSGAAPDFVGDFEDHAELGPLLVVSKGVAFLG